MTRLHLVACIGAAALAAACSSGRSTPAPSAPEQPGAPSPMQLQAPPVHALLGYREQLELSSEQIATLDSIGIWIQEANRPHSAELRRIMGTRGPVALPGRLDEETLPLLEAIAENNRAAVDGVREALTPDQQARVCEVFTSSRGSGGRVAPRSGAPGEMQGEFPRRTPWDWCGPPAGGEPQSREGSPRER